MTLRVHVPKAPCRAIVDTWALKRLPYQHFGVYVHTIELHGAFGCILAWSVYTWAVEGVLYPYLWAGLCMDYKDTWTLCVSELDTLLPHSSGKLLEVSLQPQLQVVTESHKPPGSAYRNHSSLVKDFEPRT